MDSTLIANELLLKGGEGSSTPLCTTNILYGTLALLLLLLFLLLLYILQLQRKVKKRNQQLEIQHIECSSIHATLGMMAKKIETEAFMFDEVNKTHYKYINNQFVPTQLVLAEVEKQIHPDDLEQYKIDYHNVVNGIVDECISHIRVYNSEKQQYEDFKNVIMPIKKHNGKVTRYVYIQRNETEYRTQIRKQKELIESLRMAVKSAQIVRWVRDEQSHTLLLTDSEMNERAFSIDESREFFATETDYNRFEEFLNRLSEEEITTIVLPCKMAGSKSYKPHEINGLATKGEKGELISAYGVSRDISESYEYQKALTEKVKLLETIEECMPVGISIYDKQGNLRSSNEEAARSLGIDRKRAQAEARSLFQDADPLGPFFFSLKAGESIQMMVNYNEIYGYIEPWVIPGKPHGDYFDIRCTPIVGDHSEIIGYLSICIDMTEEAKTIEILRAAKEKAEASEKLKMAFLANISHEIRTPLNAIVGFSDLLQTTEDLEERAQFMEIINTNNTLLLRLISDILDLSKLESGTLELIEEKFDMSMAITESYHNLLASCQNEHVALLLHNPYKKCLVKLDRERCLQILLNFLTNAIKFTPAGHIRMGYEYREQGLVLFIEDSGIGIPEDKTDKLFQHFEKLDEFSQGAGLGLPICKAITETMGGRVGVQSTEGKGSIFWAWIPCEVEIEA
ncbi:MAG: ATP-binding protein [Phocaeicola sp.]